MSEPSNANSGAEKVEGKHLVSEEQNTLSIIASKMLGGEMTELDKGQIDALISQRGQVYEYVHKDRKQESFDRKYYFTGAAIVTIVILVLVIFKVPQFTTEVLSLLVGAIGGYGLGKQRIGN